MTNAEKFIEVINKTFNAGFTKDNLLQGDFGATCNGSPCGLMKNGACETYDCDKCEGWWQKEYKPVK